MSDADRIKADIAATRAELAETADALATRIDQKARSGMRVLAAAAGVVGVVLLVKRLRK